MSDFEAQEELLTPGEVAALLGVDRQTVTRWASAGKLVAIRTPGGDRRYLRAEVLAITSELRRDHDHGRDTAPHLSRDNTQDRIVVPSPRDGRTTDPTSGGAVDVDPERQAAAAAVVAEAVALALEAVAAEAAEAVLVTAAVVTEAADRAAEAAESARGARAFAADAAAQSVAAEAARAAANVQARAEAAAAQVRQAAALAADELAHTVEQGTGPDAGREANLVEATAQAAAEATAEVTTQAANAVRKSELDAAAQVAQALAAAEQVIEREVTATAEAQQDLANATAVEVAAETEARATGVGLAAREAAAAVLNEDQRARSVAREADPGVHEIAPGARETRAPGRTQELEEILAAAEERDSEAELRDRAAEERERAASLRSFLGDHQQRGDDEQHATGLLDRRAAALDRIAAETDRARAAMDRAKLSAQLSAGSGAGGLDEGVRMYQVAELSHQLRAPLRSIIASVEMLEVALRMSDERLRLLVDAVTDYAIITLDPEGIIESLNTGAERIKGYTSEEVLGRHFSLFYTASDRDSGLPQRLLDRARAEGSCEHTGWRVRGDGSQFWCGVIISAAHDDTGNLTGFVEVVRDLTGQHRLERAQDSFYQAFEHDFRVPMTAIKGFAELVRDADPEHVEGLVQRVESNANRLLGMVEELIDYARLRSGPGPISLRVVDLTALTQVAVANLASIADTSRVQVSAAEPVRVIADPAALERVIANLLTNALKYSPAGSEINLYCAQGKDVGVLRIVDHGRGIDKRDLGSIFLEFERGRLAQEDSGSGLGLASVQRLIGLQDGTVTITSEVDVGTTVTVELPLAP